MTDAPIAGWYPDPQDSASWRWWSGTGWTSDVTSRAAAAPEAAPARPADWGWPDSPNTFTTAVEPEAPAKVRTKKPKLSKAERQAEAVAEPATSIDGVTPSKASKPARASRNAPAPHPTTAPPKVAPPRAAPVATGVEKANTPWIWILAFSAYIWGAVAGALQAAGLSLIGGTPDMLLYIGAAALIIALAPLWILADLDGRALRKRGFEAPSVLWMLLLPPIAYFLRRAALVKRKGGRSLGPQVALVIVTLSVIAGAVLGFSALVAALSMLANGTLG